MTFCHPIAISFQYLYKSAKSDSPWLVFEQTGWKWVRCNLGQLNMGDWSSGPIWPGRKNWCVSWTWATGPLGQFGLGKKTSVWVGPGRLALWANLAWAKKLVCELGLGDWSSGPIWPGRINWCVSWTWATGPLGQLRGRMSPGRVTRIPYKRSKDPYELHICRLRPDIKSLLWLLLSCSYHVFLTPLKCIMGSMTTFTILLIPSV